MKRTITVKGKGSVSLPPNLITLTLNTEVIDVEYDKSMVKGANQTKALNEAVESVGLLKKDLKTSNFTVRTKYDNFQDKNGQYQRKFVGYLTEQTLSLTFDFDTKLLSKTLNALMASKVDPRIDIEFSIKEKEAFNAAILKDATKNALRQAKTLTKAANVVLKDLISIDYSWTDIEIKSRSDFGLEPRMMSASFDADIQAEDVKASDYVTFVWEIE